MERTYKTTNLDLGSTIKAVTNLDPDLRFDCNGIATLAFPFSQAVAAVVMTYESGILTDAKSLLKARNQLYKRVRGGKHE